MSIHTIGPEKGLPGTIVEIRGTGFNPVASQNEVTIGGSTTRVISGSSSQLRVVALRDVASGPVVVRNGTRTATSTQQFKRDGTTTRATPLQDSDAELIVGQGYTTDRRYDMSAQGLNQKILVVLTKPSDIDPETLAPMGTTARDSVTPRLASANTFFQQTSYNKTSAAFTMTPNWIPLSKTRDFYCWQQEDIDRAQAALDTVMLDPNATQAQIDEAKNKLKTAQRRWV